jgi:hypothetical protein
MAKWTKRNNPHTQIIRVPQARPVAPIIRVSAPRAAPRKHHHRRRGGAVHGGLNQHTMINFALGGAALGFIEKSFGAQLPTVPIIGRKGTLALLAYYFSKGRGGIVRDIAIAGAVLSGYEMGATGKISGIDGDVVPQISGMHGIAAQV